MNILEIIVICVIAICALIGYHAGFLRIVYSLFAWTLALALGGIASPRLAVFLERHTGVKDALQKACVSYIAKLAEAKTSDPAIEVFGGFLEDSGLYEGIAAQAADFILRGISFLLVMVAIGILMNLLWHVLDMASRLPVVEGMNKLLGAAAGALKGLIIVWGAFCVIQLCVGTEIGKLLLGWIEESKALKALYEYNFLFMIIMKLLRAA